MAMMNVLVLFVALVLSCSAFQLPKMAVPRLLTAEVLAKKAAVAAVAVSAGLMLQPTGMVWEPAVAHAAEVVQKSIFEGKYKDPNHPEVELQLKNKLACASG